MASATGSRAAAELGLHERQFLLQCGRHALNNLLEEPWADSEMMSRIAERLKAQREAESKKLLRCLVSLAIHYARAPLHHPTLQLGMRYFLIRFIIGSVAMLAIGTSWF